MPLNRKVFLWYGWRKELWENGLPQFIWNAATVTVVLLGFVSSSVYKQLKNDNF